MLDGIFVDTWYFIATLDPSDGHHRAAARLRPLLRGRKAVTHTGILTELLAFFCDADAAGRALAARTVRRAALECDVVHVDPSLFERGLTLYEERPDKEYSLTDCISMVLMRNRGIDHVFTNDHHFAQERFTVLSDAP
jgi:predicted nucleic acid-binding protein